MSEHTAQSKWMRCIIQCDFTEQMDVYRWLISDNQYQCIWIVHNRDICEEDYTRVMPDGTEKEYKTGDLKCPHIHMIIKIPKKLSAKTVSGRFGNYVHFQVCADPVDYARYFLHQTFNSRHKFQYKMQDVLGDSDLISELYKSCKSGTSLESCRKFRDLVKVTGDAKTAVDALIDSADADTLKSIMAHPYFYSTFMIRNN